MSDTNAPVDAPRKRGRPKVSSDDDKRAHIVENARRIFMKHGYAGSTTAVVAVEAGVSKQTLYKLFESKEELFAATVNAHRRTMLDLPREREEASIAESLERIFMIDLEEDKDADRASFSSSSFAKPPSFQSSSTSSTATACWSAGSNWPTGWLSARRKAGFPSMIQQAARAC